MSGIEAECAGGPLQEESPAAPASPLCLPARVWARPFRAMRTIATAIPTVEPLDPERHTNGWNRLVNIW